MPSASALIGPSPFRALFGRRGELDPLPNGSIRRLKVARQLSLLFGIALWTGRCGAAVAFIWPSSVFVVLANPQPAATEAAFLAHFVFQRLAAAFLAIWERSAARRDSARAAPPLAPRAIFLGGGFLAIERSPYR